MESIAFLLQKIRSKREINSSCKNECNSYLIDYKEFRIEKHAKKNIIYGIDMTQMIMNKLVKNAEKYPAK